MSPSSVTTLIGTYPRVGGGANATRLDVGDDSVHQTIPLPFAALLVEQASMNINPWVSVEDVTKYLDEAKGSVCRWIESRSLPAHKMIGYR